MKIKYEFADGTVSEVEVEESIGAVIIEDRQLEDNLSRKEHYHCYSLDAAQLNRASRTGIKRHTDMNGTGKCTASYRSRARS